MKPATNPSRKVKFLVPIMLASWFILNAFTMVQAQDKRIEGIITTFDSIPVVGASIQVKSTKEVVLTDTVGSFSVSCAPKDRLKIKAHGFSEKNVRIKEKTKIVLVNLSLLAGKENRELATGYGHVLDAEKLYAISNVNENDMDFSRYATIYDIIIERFSSSARVTANGEIIIRGTVTMAASNSALLIVDGREVDATAFGYLNTADIASINILKDASASVYGSRGGNGVVIVETKRGGD